MPSASHHVSCVTHQPEVVREFLSSVLGLETLDSMRFPASVTERFLGWPSGNGGASASMMGAGAKGLVEVVGVPRELREHVAPGTALITFAVTDLEERLDAARTRGFEPSEIHTFHVNDGLEVSMAVVTAGDLTFELMRFNV